MNTYRLGIDIGSTTVKVVLLDENDDIIFGKYERHLSHTQDKLYSLLCEVKNEFGNCYVQPVITGSGAISLSKALEITFSQEVSATSGAIKHLAPDTDVAIELGGEDAKIIYFDGNSWLFFLLIIGSCVGIIIYLVHSRKHLRVR